MVNPFGKPVRGRAVIIDHDAMSFTAVVHKVCYSETKRYLQSLKVTAQPGEGI